METNHSAVIEEQIAQWRGYLQRRRSIHTVDVAELEDHLREQIGVLLDAGLAPDEAFLVAVKRLGNLDALSREFAREHSDRLWKQLVVLPSDPGAPPSQSRSDALAAFGLACAAAIAVKLPAAFGLEFERHASFYLRHAGLLVLPLLAAYFAWKRGLGQTALALLASVFLAGAIFVNLYPFTRNGNTEGLAALHLPIVLWLAAGAAYAANRWRQTDGRMDFIRFSGEWFIYFVLIALGGGVLTLFLGIIFKSIDINAGRFMFQWLVPCGAAGAVIIASWLVEAKQSVIENMAPVLTRLFTPLFAALLVIFLAALLVTGRVIDVERSMLIAFDLLLALVLGLHLYSLSARDQSQPPGFFDVLQIVLVVAALAVDAVALSAISSRIWEWGVSPNKAAALGENLVLLVNLAWTAVLYIRFLRGRVPFTALERWQTAYLPVYAIWAAIVVIVFPPLFRYI